MTRFGVAVAVAAALTAAAPAAAFTPTDSLAPKQWYLEQDHAFDAWATPPANLSPVTVAIIDSGIDASLPDFAGRIAGGRSFVGADWRVDTEGHGTFVAGLIAANLDTTGIVGLAYPAQLLIAKVVSADGTISLRSEAAAIRWAADQGARVINLSLGGLRDPTNAERDTYSALEANAVEYAYSKGAILVAAVGNSDEAPSEPWPFASYPAALPHVIGVSALTRAGNVPAFSNRDAVFNDIAAPGVGIFSTFPLNITSLRPSCLDQGYSDCGTSDYANPEGTSFAAPQVTAAAAMLLAVDPSLTNSQVSTLLEHTADDVNVTNGCTKCALLRDAYTGWGRLDVATAIEALNGPLPARPDKYETNDDAGTHAHTIYGTKVAFTATLDYYDDPVDVYRISLSGHEKLSANVRAEWAGANVGLVLWRPPTKHVATAPAALRAAESATTSAVPALTFTAPGHGWYYLEVKDAAPGFGPYSLTFAKSQPTK